ncbi:MAG: YegS/Rv2252/BmrU family lipid kinase [Candidatus Eremiobacterota bacterium]
MAHPRAEKSRVWLSVLEEIQQKGCVVKTEISRYAGHSRELAASLASQASLMVVLGGDGTIHEVVNGLFDAQGDGPKPTLACVPLGTGNDHCRGLGIRLERELLVDMLLGDRRRPMDLARVTCTGFDRRPVSVYSGCGVSAGFAAEVARRTDLLAAKSNLKGISYSVALLMCLTGYRNLRGMVEVDGEQRGLTHLFNLNVCNIRYYGGGMVAAPRADPFDGRLDVVSMELNRLEVLANLPRNYNGNFDGVAGVRQETCTRVHLTTFSRPGLVQADGQVVGFTPLAVEVVPGALEVLLPP